MAKKDVCMPSARIVDNPLPGVPHVESPFFESIFAALGLGEDVMGVARSIRDQGYAVIDMPDDDFEAVARSIVDGLADKYVDHVRITNAWEYDPNVRRLACNRRILELLETLYGRPAFPFQTLNFRVGSQQSAHVDAVHFNSVPERFMVGVWVALEDTDADNGPLIYYPGSHRLPVYVNEHLDVAAASPEAPYTHQERFTYLWESLVRIHGLEPRAFHARKGQCLIWAANLLHGGAPQLDPARSRHSQVTHYFFHGCSYYTPFCSNPIAGRVHFRPVVDVSTGRHVPHYCVGAPVPDSFIASAGWPQRRVDAEIDVCRDRHRHRFEPRFVTEPRQLDIRDDFILLHPNQVGDPPATLIVDDITLGSHREFRAGVEVGHERSDPVTFSVEIRTPDNVVPRAVGRVTVAGGGRDELAVPLSAITGRCTITLRTEMAAGATAAAYAWARFVRPRFCAGPPQP